MSMARIRFAFLWHPPAHLSIGKNEDSLTEFALMMMQQWQALDRQQRKNGHA